MAGCLHAELERRGESSRQRGLPAAAAEETAAASGAHRGGGACSTVHMPARAPAGRQGEERGWRTEGAAAALGDGGEDSERERRIPAAAGGAGASELVEGPCVC